MIRAGIPVLLLCFALFPGWASADIYSWIDDQGTQHYTTNAESIPDSFRANVQTLSLPQSPSPPVMDVPPPPPLKSIVKISFAADAPVVIALNKVDRLKAGHVAQQMETAARLGNFHALHPVSAKTGDGVPALRDELLGLLPEGPLYFPQEQRTDLSLELQLAELVREKALWLTRDEVPHAISVEVEEIEEKVVRASILVETESQKQIVVGKGGALVKEIGTRARPEIEALLGHPVFLELKVKVRPRWRRDAATLERLGL